jgi:hypothetical protein
MNANKSMIDFDTQISMDNQNIKLIRKNEVFREETGPEANELRKKLVKIHELESMGFCFCFLDYDGQKDEWYQLNLVEPSNRFEGVTLMYYPDRDLFEIAENNVQFTEMAKVEKMIKAFKI